MAVLLNVWAVGPCNKKQGERSFSAIILTLNAKLTMILYCYSFGVHAVFNNIELQKMYHLGM